MRAAFFGTPAIAVPALRALADVAEVVGVVCQPDRPAGRGLALAEPAVKVTARELGFEVHQPLKVKTGNLHEWLAERSPDVALVMAYGRILPDAVLAAPRRGCMNLHASLLPRYRGAAPINWAIVRGETETGVCLMQMDSGLDTGPVYSRRAIPIGLEETAGELAERLGVLAAGIVRTDLARAVAGELLAEPQDEAAATWAPIIEPGHTRVDWSASARQVTDLVRGMAPRPGAHTRVRGKRLKLHVVRPSDEPVAGAPGTVDTGSRHQVLVRTGDASVEIVRAQLEGRKAMGGADLINGRALAPGDILG